MAKCPPQPRDSPVQGGRELHFLLQPCVLTCFWDAVGRGAGKKMLSVGYLLLVACIALNHHQGPECDHLPVYL